jgi:hypothetical protein
MFLKGDVVIPILQKRFGSFRLAEGRSGSTSKREVHK